MEKVKLNLKLWSYHSFGANAPHVQHRVDLFSIGQPPIAHMFFLQPFSNHETCLLEKKSHFSDADRIKYR